MLNFNSPNKSIPRIILQASWDDSALQALSDLSNDLANEWEPIADELIFKNVAPIAYCNCREIPNFSSDLLEKLKTIYRMNAVRNALLFHELSKILNIARQKEISLLVLKGAALAQTVYKDPAMRPMSDIDLLVKPQDINSISKLLLEMGYQYDRPEIRPGSFAAYENERMFLKSDLMDIQVEIHWSLFDSPYYQYKLDMNWFWQTAQPLLIGELTTQMLGLEAQLLHLSGHLYLHHTLDEILLVHDIGCFISKEIDKINWDELFHHAKQYDMVIPLKKVIIDLATSWNLPISEPILCKLEMLDPSEGEFRINTRSTHLGQSSGKQFRNDLACLPDWKTRFLFISANLFPSPAYMKQRYHISHPFLLLLYYPYRWWLGLRG